MGIFQRIGSRIGSVIDDAVDTVAGAVGGAAEATTEAVGTVVGKVAEVGSGVLRAIPAQVEQAMAQLVQAQNIVQQQVIGTMRAIISQVTSGIWTGEGADAFVEEVTSLMVPASVNIASQVQQTRGAIGNALAIVEEADKRAAAVAADLADTFGSIF